MSTLRIVQQPGSGHNKYRITVSAEIPGVQALSFSREIEFAISPHETERIRWYLEDYLQFDEDPAPKIAARVETLMVERGETLFRAIFEGQNDASQLWTFAQLHLASTRIEIATGIAEATSIPWELICNPHTRANLALSAKAFVRTQWGAPPALAPSQSVGRVRILLVICRPKAEADVPFRSVASRIVKGLSDKDREAFQLDVLRPPTYEQLAKELKLAHEKGQPYHIIHFDGHGVYADPKNLGGEDQVLSNVMLKGETKGPCGYLAFEDRESKSGSKLVDGFAIGGLLRDAGVPILILNACQSAFAEASAKPNEDAAATALEEIEAYGSLAQAVMNAGAAGVVAMRYSVYVVTAAQFVAELYGALARGRTLGEAVAFGRRNLASQPDRKIAYDARPLQDWVVPVVWERTPLSLWPQQEDGAQLRIRLDASGVTAGGLDRDLPKPPDVGFFGRDETLYALDRAFDSHKIVLLHAYAGSGKTATATEFARWYKLTGGIEGPVLFTSFERRLPLARALDKIGEVFGPALERSGFQWGATNDARRREVALSVLRQIPVLWVWDNIEPITGFPAGTPSDWNAAEQRELRDFLSDARETKAKFLLTSRRDEQAWLGEIPRRVQTPPMPMQERLQLAGAVIERRGRRLADLPDLTLLLKFTQGNPLTILITVGEALRAGIDTKDNLDAFVEKLRGGEAQFEDGESEGRTKSLGVSLSYGFASAFSDDERKRLALLHLFQGFVDVNAICLMGAPDTPDAEWALDEVRGLTRDEGIALLNRAGEIGLLVPHEGGHYAVHPALPWYFRGLFARHFDSEGAERARRAFVEAISQLGAYYVRLYGEGDREVLRALMAEEDNMLAAWRLARQRGWWGKVVEAMSGLRTLYEMTGRYSAWKRLVEAVTPDFVDPRTDLPLPGREDEWTAFSVFRVRLAREDLDFAKAERVQRIVVDYYRARATAALAMRPEQRDDARRQDIRTLAAATHELAQIQLRNSDTSCAVSFSEAFDMARTIGDRAAMANCAHNLGLAYSDVAELRDFDAAERWLRQSIDLRPAGDNWGRAKSLMQLGQISIMRFDEALSNGQSLAVNLLLDASLCYEQSLQLLPETAILDVAAVHNQLGLIYMRARDFDSALHHFQECIQRQEGRDVLGAAGTRANAAFTLLQAERFADARAYADAALTNYREFGDRAAAQIRKTEKLLAAIEQAAATRKEHHEGRPA